MASLDDLLALLCGYPGLEAERFTTGVQASPPSGSYVGVAAGDDATRQVVSTDLARRNKLGDGSDTDTSWYNGAYVLLETAIPLQRRVVQANGYAPAEEAASATDQALSEEYVGVLTLERGLGSTIAAGTEAGIYGPLPPLYDADRRSCLRTYLNRAASAMTFPVRVAFDGDDGVRRYDAPSWIRDPDDLIAVHADEALDDVDPDPLPGIHDLRLDGVNAYLILGSAPRDGVPFYADFRRRRHTWIAVTGKATATAVAGAITSIAVTRGGTYTTAPTVAITGAGTGATAHAVLTDGTVTSIVVDTGGSGYATATTTVTLSAGEYATSTVGLVNPDDRISGPPEDMAAVAYALVCDALSYREGQGTDQAWVIRRGLVDQRVAPYLASGQPRSRRPVPVGVTGRRSAPLLIGRRPRWS